MRTKTRFLFLCCGILVLCSGLLLSTRAVAQDEGVNPRLTFLAGASLLSGSRSFVIGPRLFDTQFQNGGKIGVRGTFDIGGHWGVEGAYSIGFNGLQATQVTPPAVQNFSVHVHQLTGNALYFFTGASNTLRPFVTAGIGLSRYSPTSDAKLTAAQDFLGIPAVITSTSEFDFNFGAGIETRPWEHLGIRFDLRDHLTGIPRFGLSNVQTSPGAPFFPVQGRVQDFEIVAGLSYYFAAK